MAWVFCAKFLLTIVALGLGVPGGIIGPVFVIGMLSGVLLASPLGFFVSDVPGFVGELPDAQLRSYPLLGREAVYMLGLAVADSTVANAQ